MDYKILVVEDEKNISDIIKFNLVKEGYEVVCAYDGEEGLNMFNVENPDLILLDIMMPKMDGLSVCKEIRKTSDVPIIMLTAKAEEADKVLGLEALADDYVTKPFGNRELMARIKANLRRSGKIQSNEKVSNEINISDIKINLDKYEIYKGDELIPLTKREFELVLFLANNKDQVFSREDLLLKVWNYEYYGDVRTVDVTIRRLRIKLEDNPETPVYILTKRGVGYHFGGVDEKH